MKNIILATLFSTAIHMYAFCQTERIIEFDVWEGKQPIHASTITAPQGINEQGHITNCQNARVELYIPQSGADKTVIICPGGGYGIIAVEHEGRQFARYLSQNGIAAAVLSYRMPNGVHQIPLEDAIQTLKTIKKYARKWKLNPHKVGVMGFSAGGHLASTLSVRARPAFSILFYPVISDDPDIIHAGSFASLTGGDKSLYGYYSAEKHVTSHTPPTLLFHSTDDNAVPVENSRRYRDALISKGINTKLIEFSSGGHGWGFQKSFAWHEQMKSKLLEWLQNL